MHNNNTIIAAGGPWVCSTGGGGGGTDDRNRRFSEKNDGKKVFLSPLGNDRLKQQQDGKDYSSTQKRASLIFTKSANL
jgi:hypothetical protein